LSHVTPVLAGAGIVGLAIGLALRTWSKISSAVSFSSWKIKSASATSPSSTAPGISEAISFRTIVLRDEAAVVHVFPNGAITTLSNMTKDWSAYVITVNVAYKEDPDRVADVMRRG
jgi:small conductance mechanosensitive channel